MENTQKKRLFIQLQCSVTLLACTLLPDFGNVLGSLIGLGGLSFVVIIARIIGLVGAGLSGHQLYQSLKDSIPPTFLYITAGTLALTLLTLFPGIPIWLDYIALVGAFIVMYLSKSSLGISWNYESTQGAYLILLTTIFIFYHNIDDKICTSIAGFVANIIFLFYALSKFGKSLDADGQASVSKLKIAAWLGVAASFLLTALGWIPIVGIVILVIATIIFIIAYIIQLIAYGDLSHCAILGEEGKAGAGKLRTSLILIIIACILSPIPLVGKVGGLLTIFAMWFTFKGWHMIVNGLEADQQVQEPATVEETVSNNMIQEAEPQVQEPDTVAPPAPTEE